ncbi:hypothetical protein ACULLL_12185 [Lysinibacillus irui]|uniref:hypothetical protein n=1 Tax=Lysinibacillus irui TaxID=2998077 RepID=UPI004043E29C
MFSSSNGRSLPLEWTNFLPDKRRRHENLPLISMDVFSASGTAKDYFIVTTLDHEAK